MTLRWLVFLCLWPVVIMAMAWLVQRLTKVSAWVDTLWTFSVASGLGLRLCVFSPHRLNLRGLIIMLSVGLWSLRLGGHMLGRALKGKEDPRYADLLQQWGNKAGFNLFIFLQIQALASCVLIGASYAACYKANIFTDICDGVGFGLILVALIGELIADAQMARFSKKHAGQSAICDTGLWAWSHHPNYFFEWLMWFGLALMATDPMHLSLSLCAWAAPVMMYILLVHVSGLPPLEAHMLRSRGAAFKAYQSRTNGFFPWPPRKNPSSIKDKL